MAFPAVALVDSFKRANESPLSNGGKWSLIAGSITTGHIGEEAYGPSSSYAEGEDNAYWNVRTYSSPALAVQLITDPSNPSRSFSLWGCLSSPGTGERSGYRLVLLRGGGYGTFTAIIQRVTKGVPTVLSETACNLELGDHFGLSIAKGQVTAWKKLGAGAWTVVSEVADATYTNGYVGVGGRGNIGRLRNFEAGYSYEHTFTVSQATSPSARRAPSRALSPSQGQAASAARAPARALSVGQAQASALRRDLARSLSATAAGTVTLARDRERLLTVAQPTAGLLARSLARTLTVSQGQLAELADEVHEAPHSAVGISSSSVQPKLLVSGVAV